MGPEIIPLEPDPGNTGVGKRTGGFPGRKPEAGRGAVSESPEAVFAFRSPERSCVVKRVQRSAAGALAAIIMLWVTEAASASSLSGHVVDAQTGKPVAASTVRVAESQIGVAAGDDGSFRLDNLPGGWLELVIHHVGYHPWRGMLVPFEQELTIRLEPIVLPGQDIVVTTTRAKRGESPVAFENMSRQEIKKAYYAQDMAQLLTETPGVYAYSENGNNIGNSVLSIRGFPQRRVSVLINGVPLNDPESHEVWWIDLPDLSESLEDAQIQRGVGTTLYGANSMGGTINLLTNYLSPMRQFSVTSGYGSYGTRKFSVSLNSGLIDDRYSMYGRFSRIVSDGYRMNAWVDMWSYFFAAARYDAKWTNRLNIFGGPERAHLTYNGAPRWYMRGDTTYFDTAGVNNGFTTRRPSGNPDVDRRFNPLEWPQETDNFSQPQYQWITEFRPDTNWRLENTAFYIKGRGYYDQLRPAQDYRKYHLSASKVKGQISRRKWVENDFWGFVPRATRRHPGGSLTFGGEVQHLHADHWGEVLSADPAPVTGFTPSQRYYDYEGAKTVVSGFAQEVCSPLAEVTVTSAVQFSFKEYKLYDSRFANAFGQKVSQTTRYNIVSPRLGVTLRPFEDMSLFGSISYNRQEPTNDEIFSASEYGDNANDFFAHYDSATGVGSNPIMKPERLMDYEIGATLIRSRWQVTLNLYDMRFHDEIVYGGGINDNGEPIRANAPSSTHRGIEMSGKADLGMGFNLSGNLSVNDSRFKKFAEYIWTGDTTIMIDRSGNAIVGSPQLLANLRGEYSQRYFAVSARVFGVGRQYIDNSNSRSAAIAPHAVIDIRGDLKLAPLTGSTGLSAYVQINNVLDREYETGGYLDDYGNLLFLPAAKRNFYVGLRAAL
jgi:iron complex outermembrane receptor protein